LVPKRLKSQHIRLHGSLQNVSICLTPFPSDVADSLAGLSEDLRAGHGQWMSEEQIPGDSEIVPERKLSFSPSLI